MRCSDESLTADPRKCRGHDRGTWMPLHLTRPARHDRVVELVELMLTSADRLR